MTEIIFKTATELVGCMQSGELSAVEVMEAHLRRIELVNPRVNALCTVVPEQALQGAREADQKRASGAELGTLHGLPVPIKDLTATKGIRTTWGSPIYKDTVPARDDLIVTRLKQAGAIVIGKSNTPEFGAGSHTFNQVFGSTRNPYNMELTAGGSSGGAAAALACFMAPIAEGSDFGGSLRNPAAWCNVIGFRTTLGVIPRWPLLLGWSTMSVNGPMARTVEDVALLCSVMAGPDTRCPVSSPEPGSRFANLPERNPKGLRLAWCDTVGNRAMDPLITGMLKGNRHTFTNLGCLVESAEPQLEDADEIFNVYRALIFAHTHKNHLENHRELIKETIIWNTEEGLKLTALDLARAEMKRTKLWERMSSFWQQYDYLVMPVTSLPPFPIEVEYPVTVAGQKMATYTDWMWPCYVITVTGSPAISVPGGFTPNGLPIGLQIIGRPHDDVGVLQLARSFEDATRFAARKPLV